MSENGDGLGEGAQIGNGLVPPETLHSLQASIASIFQSEYQKIAGRHQEKAPVLTQKGLMMQAEVNVKVINRLQDGLMTGSLDEAVKEVVDILKRRNQELTLLDQDPVAFKNMEKLKAMKAVTGAGNGSGDDTALLALAQMMSSSDAIGKFKKPPQQARKQWFPRAGPVYRQYGVREFQAQSAIETRPSARAFQARSFNSEENRGKRSEIHCFRCNQIGHYSNQCNYRQ